MTGPVPRLVADVSRFGDEAVVRLRGELDDGGAADARRAVEEAFVGAPGRLVLELGGLLFMDSAGIWLLVDTHRRCLDAGVELRLAGEERPAVAHALALSGLDQLIRHGEARAEEVPADGEPVQLRLYISSRSPARVGVLEAVRALRERVPGAALAVEVLDVFEAPDRAQADRVIATPTLIRVAPAPQLRLVGSLSDPEAVLHHLGLTGAP